MSLTRQKIAIYGAGGHAREIANLIASIKAGQLYELVGFIEDGASTDAAICGLPIFSWNSFVPLYPDALLTVAIGSPTGRREVADRCAASGVKFPTLVHPSVDVIGVTMGEGSVFCKGSIFTVNVTVGRHVHVNIGCTISHDVVLGDFTTVSPGVHIAGNVRVGREVFLGVGVSIINGTSANPLLIGDGAVIAAGACVTANTQPNCLYAGLPARLKRRYD